MHYRMIQSKDQSDWNKVQQSLIDFNSEFMSTELTNKYEEICLVVKDEQDKICGGLNAVICWNFMEISMIFIDEEIRNYGYGRKLMEQVEQIALNEKCDFIKLDTLEFQAKEFYEKLGYKVFGEIENVAKKYKHYYMIKDLIKEQ